MNSLKQRVMNLARQTQFLPVAEYVRFLFSVLKNRAANRQFLSKYSSFSPPPQWLAYDAYGHTNWEFYEKSGLLHASFFAELILKNCHSKTLKVLDWGCGPGRLIRHLPKLLASRTPSIYGCDYNDSTIEWCRSNLTPMHFEKNQLSPPLPFENQFFNAVYALSVLTHLSEEKHFEWVQELKRILKPGGILIVTTHGEAYRDKLLNQELAHYDSHHLVVRKGVKEGKRCYTAFHPPRFIRETLFKSWKMLEHFPSPISKNLVQDVWVFQRDL
jgi:SAM-dependent methyltransferase